MWGCWSRAASWISRSNRSTLTPAPISGGSTLMTTWRPSAGLLGEEDAAHPAAAQLPQDAVGVPEGGLETLLQLHGGSAGWGCGVTGSKLTVRRRAVRR